MLNGKQLLAASVTKDKLSLTDPSSPLDPATQQWVLAQIKQSVYNQDWKASVRVASTVNVNLASPGAIIDGINLNTGDSVLLKNQTTAAQNGIYNWFGTALPMTRREDADSATEVTPAMAVSVEEGVLYALTSWKLTTTGAIVVGTTALNFQLLAVFVAPVLTTNNKDIACATTANDGDLACATGIAGTPVLNSVVTVIVNGITEQLGNGIKAKACYFSGDSGASARSWSAITAGDKLYWNGSVAGYQLAATDSVSFLYTN